jgi:hypothetical protein
MSEAAGAHLRLRCEEGVAETILAKGVRVGLSLCQLELRVDEAQALLLHLYLQLKDALLPPIAR